MDVDDWIDLLFESMTAFALYATPVIAFLGIVGNLLSAAVLLTSREYRGKSYARLLLFLTASDAAFIISCLLLEASQARRWTEEQVEKFVTVGAWPLSQFSLTASILATVSICVERYVVVRNPFSQGPRVNLVLLSVSAAVLLNLPFCFECEVGWLEGAREYEYFITDFRMDTDYVRYYVHAAYPTLAVFLPFAAIVVFSVLIIAEVRKAERARRGMAAGGGQQEEGGESRVAVVTRLLVTVILVFLVCHLWRIVTMANNLYAYHAATDNPWESLFLDALFDDFNLGKFPLTHFFLILNSSCNILIYGWRDPNFKRALKEILCQCHRKRSTPGGSGRVATRT